MIHVVYDRMQTKVSVTGHAESAQYGQDLVCAAASILAYTLAENVSQMVENGQAEDAILQLEPGSTMISVLPYGCTKSQIIAAFDTIICGYELLAEQNPDHVTFTQVSVDPPPR